MSSSSLIKVVAAFVTGILVALVGALAYVKIADRSPSEPVVKTQATQAAAEQTASEALPDRLPDTQMATSNPSQTKPLRHDALSTIGHKFTHPAGEKVAQLDPPQASGTPRRELPANPYSENETNPIAPPAPVANSAPVQQQAPSEPQGEGLSQPRRPDPPARQPQTVTLERGTSVAIRLNEALSTDHNYTGDTFRGTLEQPIIINGFIIAERGSKVLGRVVNAETPGRVQGVADLSLALTELNTTDGQRIGIQTNAIDKKGGSNSGRNAGKVAGGAALGAIIGAIAGGGKGAGIGAGIGGAAGAGDVLLTHGKAAVVPNETVLTFRLSAPVAITERLN